MYNKHQSVCTGDMSFMESLIPPNVKVWHMDSYNNEHGKRFQGSFYYEWNDAGNVKCNEAPLPVLAISKNYIVRSCDCLKSHEHHMIWTIWFD